jgi:carboxylesterase
MIPLLVALGAGAAAWTARSMRARRLHAEVARRLPVGPTGIIPGAEPYTLAGRPDGPAVMLLHGFGDTPQSMRYLGGALHAAGWTVHAPLFPGHGRTLADYGRSGARDWLAHARDELATLRARHADVALAGLSMGGAVASVLAAETPDLRALVLLAPYLSMPTRFRRLARAHRLVELALPWAKGGGEASIRDADEAERNLAYRVVAPHLLRELLTVVETAQRVLPQITTPTLVLHSRNDHRVPVEAAEREYAKLRMPQRELVWFDECGHLMTVDREHHAVSACVRGFLARHVATVERAKAGAG